MNHFGDDISLSSDAKERLTRGERVEDHQSSVLDTCNPPAIPLPPHSVLRLHGKKGQFPTGGEADSHCMAVTFRPSGPQAGTVPFWLPPDPLTATSRSSFCFSAASTQAAEEADGFGPQTVLPAHHSARSPLELQTAGKPGNALPSN